MPDGAPQWTEEQRDAIERRDGRPAARRRRGQRQDVGAGRALRARRCSRTASRSEAILTITFTEKAAGELRERIRARLARSSAPHELRGPPRARSSRRSTASAPACCARTRSRPGSIRGSPCSTSRRPARLGDAAFDEALEDLARNEPGGVDLIAAYTPAALRSGDPSLHDELRSRGQVLPALPPLPPLRERARSRRRARRWRRLRPSCPVSSAGIDDPGVRVVEALERLEPLHRGARRRGRRGAVAGRARRLRAARRQRRRAEHRGLRRLQRGARRLPSRARAPLGARAFTGLLGRLLRGLRRALRRRKRERSGVDFEDLELLTRDLLRSDRELRERYRERFDADHGRRAPGHQPPSSSS